MQINLTGLLEQIAERMERSSERGLGRVVRSLLRNLAELRSRTASGDLGALDEFFEIYEIDGVEPYVRVERQLAPVDPRSELWQLTELLDTCFEQATVTEQHQVVRAVHRGLVELCARGGVPSEVLVSGQALDQVLSQICDCGLQQRQHNPFTGRCDACGRPIRRLLRGQEHALQRVAAQGRTQLRQQLQKLLPTWRAVAAEDGDGALVAMLDREIGRLSLPGPSKTAERCSCDLTARAWNLFTGKCTTCGCSYPRPGTH